MSFDAGSIIGTADLDRSPFNAGLDQAKADAEAFEERTYKVSVGVDKATFDADDDDISAKLDALGAKKVTPKVDLDTTDADAKRLVEEAALDEFDKRKDVIKPEMDDSGIVSGLRSIKENAAEAAGSGGLGLLLTTALSVGPALVPIGAVAVAGLAAIAPMALAAGAGIGAFALAAAGDLGKVETAAEGTLKNFQALAAPEVMPVINGSLGLIIPLFATLMPLVSGTAGELEHLETAAGAALQAPFWRGFISFIGSEAGPALNSFASLAGGLVKAFAGISVAFAPVIADVEGGMDGFAARIAAWGQGLSASNGLASFLAYVEREGPVVGTLLSSLGGSVEHLLVGLAPVGAVVLTGVTALARLVDVLTAVNPLLTTVGITVLGAVYAWGKLAPLIDSAQAAMLRFSTTAQGVEGVAGGSEGALAEMVATMGGLGPALAIVAGVAAVAAGAFALGKAQTDSWNGSLAQLMGSVETLPTSSLPQLDTAVDATRSRITDLATQAGFTSDQIAILTNRAQGSVDLGFSPMGEALGELGQHLRDLEGEQTTYNDNLGYLQAQFGVSRQSAEDLATSINLNLGKALTQGQVAQFGAALDTMSAKAGLTASALQQMAAAGGVSASTLATDMTNAANATKTAWAGLGNAVTNFASATLPPTAAAIAAFYATSELQGAQFTANIQAAIKDGYSPTLISSIIQAGPAQASQLLQGLVNAQGSGLQALISQATQAMTKEGQEAVQEARLTQVAITASSSTTAAALPTALAISQALTATNAAAQVQAVASSLTGGLPQLLAVAKEYGIALPNGLLAQVQGALAGGTAQAQAVSAAMRANQGETNAAATATANALPLAVQGAYGPAAIAGQGLMGQVAGGITIASGLVTAAASSGAFVAGSAFANGANWPSIGHDIDAGIAGGIAGGTGLLQTAIASLAGHTLLAGQSAINANSPSRLFRDQIGLPIAQGIAVGITSGQFLVTGAIGALLSATASTARGIAIPTVGGLVPGGIVPGQFLQSGGAGSTGPTGPSITQNPGYNPNGYLDAITGLAQGYATRSGVVLNSAPNIQITVPNGTSAELASSIATMVSAALADHDTALLAELDAIG